MRLCPLCNRPANPFGRALAVASGQLVGVVGICARCHINLLTKPTPRDNNRLHAACSKALQKPARYLATVCDSTDEAKTICGLLGHPSFSGKTQRAIQWQ